MSKEFNESYDKWFDDCGKFEPSCDDSYSDGWHNCKKCILEILKIDQLGVGNYGLNGEIQGIIHRLEIMDKIRKL